jgi:hypothetical protein
MERSKFFYTTSSVSLIEGTIIFLLLSVISIFYFYFDTKTILALEIFPWDSNYYRSLAENLHSNEVSQLVETPPFGYRVLFPWMYGLIHNIFGISYIYSALALNLISSYIALLLYYILWRREGCSKKISWVGVIYFSVFWLGPIRQSIFYPGGSFAFELLLITFLFFILTRPYNGMKTGLINIASIFILSLGREFITYIVLFVTVTHMLFKFTISNINIQQKVLHKFIEMVKCRNTLNLFLLSCSSIAAYIYVRQLVESHNNSSYSVIETIFTYGWFHLHLLEFMYPLLYSFGVIAIILLVILMLKKFRNIFFFRICESIKNLDILLLFCIIGIIFGMLGGTDSDRFLLWFFPYFFVFFSKCIDVLIGLHNRNTSTVIFILAFVSLFVSRFYVPATPNIFFPGDGKYGSQASIKTDYNPSLYYGLNAMENFRLPLKEVPIEDAFVYGSREINVDNIGGAPKIPVSIGKSSSDSHWYRGHYKYEINNIPFPFGFSHNQYELFSAHPFYGGRRIKVLLLLQWAIVFLVVVVLLRRV